MSWSNEEAREHFDKIDEIIREARSDVAEETRHFVEEHPGSYSYCQFYCDVRAILRLHASGHMSRQDAARLLTMLKRTRMIHPSMRVQYEDWKQAHSLLREIDQRAERLMNAEG